LYRNNTIMKKTSKWKVLTSEEVEKDRCKAYKYLF